MNLEDKFDKIVFNIDDDTTKTKNKETLPKFGNDF